MPLIHGCLDLTPMAWSAMVGKLCLQIHNEANPEQNKEVKVFQQMEKGWFFETQMQMCIFILRVIETKGSNVENMTILKNLIDF